MSDDASTGPDNLDPVDDVYNGEGHWDQRDHDGVRSLRDLQEESGDEDEVDDLYAMDRREASEAGVALDPIDDSEAPLS